MPEIIERAKRIKQSLKLDEIVKTGFHREIRSKADSHHTVTYPQKDSASFLEPTNVFYQSSYRRDLGLYVHIPFCTGKCSYCHYVTNPNQSDEKVSTYLSALHKEIDLVAATPEVQNSRIFSAYIGGGTPTFLSPDNLETLLINLRSKFSFLEDAEFTVEASPETILGEIGMKRLKMLRKYGVNRLSLGVQTFNDEILSSVRRRHSAREGVKAIKRVKNLFDIFNIDLLVGLPNENLDILEHDIDIALDLGVPSVTTYPLTIRPESAIYRLFEKNPFRFPDEDTFLTMYILAMEKFGDKGYLEYPSWWFIASPNHVYRQQIHKWEDNGELVALGVSGYGYINNWQYYNFRTLGEYTDAINKGRLPIWKGANLPTVDEQATRNLVLGIKCKVNKRKFQKRYGFYPEDRFGDTIKKLRDLGLISNTTEEIKLTYTGRLFAEEVGRCFIK